MYRRALEIYPTNAPAFANLGSLLMNNARFGEALTLADAAAGRGAPATLLRVEALDGLGRGDEALAACALAQSQGADPYEVEIRRGQVLRGMARYGEALAAFDASVALRPDAGLARFRRGLGRLMSGDFAGGWPDLEHRWRDEAFLASSAPLVAGQIRSRLDFASSRAQLAGKRILVLGEQGIGDELMFASVIPDLAAIAASVVYVCDARLVRLLTNAMPGVTITGPREARISLSDVDTVLPVGSLPLRFRMAAEAFPGTPFGAVRPEVRQRWADRLGTGRSAGQGAGQGPLLIGISWRGGTGGTRGGARSIALEPLLSAFEGQDFELMSLQYGDPSAELAAASAATGRPITAFPPADLADFEDLAGLMESLDLVVSVQNATVHLAGAIGKPCIALLPHSPEWRYMAQGETMPWYRAVRLMRQDAPGDWSSVLRRVAAAVSAWPRGAGKADA